MPQVRGTTRETRTTRNSDNPYGTISLENVKNEEPTWRQWALADARDGKLCPLCLGIQWVRQNLPIEHDDFGKLFPCECNEGNLTAYLKDNSGLHRWMMDASFDTYWQGEERLVQKIAVMNLLKHNTGWLTLWGPYGRSKTFLLATAVNAVLAEGKPAVYVTLGRLLDSLRDSYGRDRFSHALRQWQTCKVLALDEIDKYHRTEWAHDKVQQLLDYRYNEACSPGSNSITMFASNAEPGGDGWPADLGPLYSRMTQFEIVECGGPDVRPMQKGKAL